MYEINFIKMFFFWLFVMLIKCAHKKKGKKPRSKPPRISARTTVNDEDNNIYDDVDDPKYFVQEYRSDFPFHSKKRDSNGFSSLPRGVKHLEMGSSSNYDERNIQYHSDFPEYREYSKSEPDLTQDDDIYANVEYHAQFRDYNDIKDTQIDESDPVYGNMEFLEAEDSVDEVSQYDDDDEYSCDEISSDDYIEVLDEDQPENFRSSKSSSHRKHFESHDGETFHSQSSYNLPYSERNYLDADSYPSQKYPKNNLISELSAMMLNREKSNRECAPNIPTRSNKAEVENARFIESNARANDEFEHSYSYSKNSKRSERRERRERSKRPEKSEYLERPERKKKSERPKRSEYSERGKMKELTEIPKCFEKSKYTEKPQRPARFETINKSEKIEFPERPTRSQIPERPARSQIPERPQRLQMPERPGRSQMPERPTRSQMPDRPPRSQIPERPPRFETNQKSERIEMPERPTRLKISESSSNYKIPKKPQHSQQKSSGLDRKIFELQQYNDPQCEESIYSTISDCEDDNNDNDNESKTENRVKNKTSCCHKICVCFKCCR